MNPIRNPFFPGTGMPPLELAGRDELRETLRIALERARIGRSAKSAMLVGLRGAGKTVLLDRIRMDAELAGIHTVRIEAPEGRSLPALLAPQLRQALLRLSQIAAAKDLAVRGLRALAGFAGKLKLTFADIEVGIDFEPEPGLADNGDLEHDLQALFEQVGLAAKAAHTALAIFIDELQYVEQPQLAALITAMHRTEQRQLPLVLVGAGLPQLRGQMGNAKSYAERLFDFPLIGPLPPAAAGLAIEKPLAMEGVEITPQALSKILQLTQGYPYFWTYKCVKLKLSLKPISRRSKMHGTVTLGAEVTNVSTHCFWLLLGNEELAVPFTEFPWFKKATIEQLSEVQRLTEDHLYWPQLDVDLSIESIRSPENFPLVSRSAA